MDINNRLCIEIQNIVAKLGPMSNKNWDFVEKALKDGDTVLLLALASNLSICEIKKSYSTLDAMIERVDMEEQ